MRMATTKYFAQLTCFISVKLVSKTFIQVSMYLAMSRLIADTIYNPTSWRVRRTGYLFTSCLCQQPERARYERVRAFDINKASVIKPRSNYLSVSRELCSTCRTREFSSELVFWTQTSGKNSLTIEPNASPINIQWVNYDLHDLHETHEWFAWKSLCASR